MALYLDISQWQDPARINWDKLKKEIDGIILRVGYRGYGSSGTLVVDNRFETFAKQATAAGIPTGGYFFSQAKNAAEGKAEADFAIPLYKKTNMKLPLFIDTEPSTGNGKGRADNISNAARTAAVVAFCNECQAKGIDTGVYASASWFSAKLDYSKVKGFKKWVAAYGTNEATLKSRWGISSWYLWQFTSGGSLDGYNGTAKDSLDLSYPGADFAKKAEPAPAPKYDKNGLEIVNSCKGLSVRFLNGIWRTRKDATGKAVNYTGIAPNDAGWWYVKNGIVDFKKNGVEHNDNGWWSVFDGKVDFKFTGWRNNAAGRWYCVNGKVDFDRTVKEAAKLVWQGKFGNGTARTKNMKAAGFSAEQIKDIQKAVTKGVGK